MQDRPNVGKHKSQKYVLVMRFTMLNCALYTKIVLFEGPSWWDTCGRSHECSTCPPLVRRDINVSLFSLAALSTSFRTICPPQRRLRHHHVAMRRNAFLQRRQTNAQKKGGRKIYNLFPVFKCLCSRWGFSLQPVYLFVQEIHPFMPEEKFAGWISSSWGFAGLLQSICSQVM